jgi:modulator of FtsH protease HflK
MSGVAVAPVTGRITRPHNSYRLARFVLPLPALWLLSGIYFVAADQQAVVTRFGAVVETRALPGVHWALPWPIDTVHRLRVRQLRRVVIGGELPDGVTGWTQPLTSQFLTGDQNIIHMRVVAQYSVSDPSDYLFRAVNADDLVRTAVESDLGRRVALTGVDDVLTTEKAQIQNHSLSAAERILDAYHAGIILSSVNIESVSPPPDAAAAFRDVASARADSARIVNEAEGYRSDIIPRARGEATQLLDTALAYRTSKVNRAQGEASRFLELASQYEKAPQVTGTRAYLETMEQILPKIRKLIIDADGNVDLTVIRRNDSSQFTKK